MEIMNHDLREELLDEWGDGSGTLAHYPKRSDYSVETAQNGPSIAVGGGLDVVVTRPFAWRVLSLEYTYSWMNDVAQIHPQRDLKVGLFSLILLPLLFAPFSPACCALFRCSSIFCFLMLSSGHQCFLAQPCSCYLPPRVYGLLRSLAGGRESKPSLCA